MAGERLAPFADRITLVHAVYDEFAEVVDALGIPVDAALFDLGVSSLHLDETDRGFAYRVDAPLDMRMDQTRGLTAADVLNGYEPADLERILRDFGEERYARSIVRAIVADRAESPTRHRAAGRHAPAGRPEGVATQRGHPAKRTFQALRIEVNGELDAWRRALPAAVGRLRVGGRVADSVHHSSRPDHQRCLQGAALAPSGRPPVERRGRRPCLTLLLAGAVMPTRRNSGQPRRPHGPVPRCAADSSDHQEHRQPGQRWLRHRGDEHRRRSQVIDNQP